MKAKNLFFGALTCLAFAACSNDDEVIVNDNVQGEVNGEGYIALSINLPTEPSSRTQNDQFDDGLPSEYAVNDGWLILFNSDNEATAKVQGVYELELPTWNNSSDNNVTNTSAKMIQKVAAGAQAGWGALVVLNANGNINANSFIGYSFDQVMNHTISNASTTGLLMTNAPLANSVASASYAGDIKTLATIAGVYGTENEAKSGTASQVYVERAVAKVTLQQPVSITLDSYTWNITGWAIDNTNKTSYLVRNTTDVMMNDWAKLYSNATQIASNDAYKYRFIGTTGITEGAPTYKYRTYFAKDMNYDRAVVADELAPYATLATTMGAANPLYCFENTFDVEHQKDANTTRVVLEAKVGTGADVYTRNNISTELYDVDAINNLAKSALFTAMGGETYWATVLASGKSYSDADWTITYNTTSEGTTTVASIVAGNNGTFTDFATVNTAIASALSDINDAFGLVTKYTDGKCYYAVRIKHFGDDLTPWDNGEDPLPATTAVYPTANQDGNYLGRYGVLRNNWYDLSVSSVKQMGSVTVPDVEASTWDDEMDSYVVLQINILSWAKRNQNVEL